MDYREVNIPEVIANWEKWWDGELGRPLVVVTAERERKTRPVLEPKRFTAHYGFDVAVEDIIKTETLKLSGVDYFADSFPIFWPNFGPGVEAVFVGGKGEVAEETIWFEPGKFKDVAINEMSFKLDYDNAWFKWIEKIYKAGAAAWSGQVIQGMTDIGGGLDVLSSFRPGEALLLDLYDNPEEVKRLSHNLNECWFDCFDYYTDIIRKASPGSSCWAGILSKGTCYMQQCDFAYMISPEMFEEFVKPDVAYAAKRMDRSFYHLDGIGQIGHIKHLCDIPELDGIQWVPGDGQRDSDQWPEVLREIESGGKKIQLFIHGSGGITERVRRAFKTVNDPSCMQLNISCPEHEKTELFALLRDYGINV